MFKRAAVCIVVLMLIPRPITAETLTVGSEGMRSEFVTYVFCLALCPVGEPFAWLGGESVLKKTFWPNRIKIDTNPSDAQVQVFFRRGAGENVYGNPGYHDLEKFRGTTPIKLRAAPLFGFGKQSYYSLIIFKSGHKPLIKELKVSGSADYVFNLEPLDEPLQSEPEG